MVKFFVTWKIYNVVASFSGYMSLVPIGAKLVALFMIFLKKANFISKLRDIYIISHNLGAHVSGLAGVEINLETNKKIGRITGVDPAGYLYSPSLPNKKLMQENALFIDIIHTNSGLLGSLTNDGYVDFWCKFKVIKINIKYFLLLRHFLMLPRHFLMLPRNFLMLSRHFLILLWLCAVGCGMWGMGCGL